MSYSEAEKQLTSRKDCRVDRWRLHDCLPLDKKVHNPISKKLVDFSNTDEYKFRMELLESLKRKR